MKNMKKYIIETRLKSRLDLVRDCVMAESKILAHKAMNEKYGSDYCASASLSEETEKTSYVCPICHNTDHLSGARFCMICGEPLPLSKQRKA